MHRRKRGTRGNPLRRAADRTRTRMHAAFALTCLLAVIAGLALGRAVWTDGHRAAEDTARHRRTVTATTVGGTTLRAGDRPSSPPLTVATATWYYPAHRTHTEAVPVPAATRSGETVRVWVDDDGRAATAPPDRAHIALNAAAAGAGAMAGTVLVGGALVAVRLRIVDARSGRSWETEWAGIEPLWSGRLRPGQGAGDD
ncbi:Rv1733c family protein [Streptomyces sp. NBC_00273]|uniref:Rv1733c family protein n=1 Tax=Streptomyces sp. NBC_00273 TaxID=2903644 RepID=UPI003FA6CD4F